ncbi:MAG: hypothetical protein WBF53_06500 [Litorimonas sp.]
MKFIPYLGLVVSFALGWLAYPFFYVFIVAVASAVTLFPLRRRQLREQPQAPDQNMVLDGAFLVVQQTILHFVVYALGIFMVRMMGG